MLYLCQIYGQDKAEKCLIKAYDMPEISVTKKVYLIRQLV